MLFDLSIHIVRAPEDVFLFLRDKDRHPQEPGSPVLVLEKTTPGPARVGTRYREVVQMLPFYRGEIRSELTRCKAGLVLEERWRGAGMVGLLQYTFLPERGGTRLRFREAIQPRGLARLLEPWMEATLRPKLKLRLEEIKEIVERGWEPA